jgi:hypothetical protein
MKREKGLSPDLDLEDSIETRSWTGLLKVSPKQLKGRSTDVYSCSQRYIRFCTRGRGTQVVGNASNGSSGAPISINKAGASEDGESVFDPSEDRNGAREMDTNGTCVGVFRDAVGRPPLLLP